MNTTIESQLNHRTIRFFKDKSIDSNIVHTLLNVFNRTATSQGLQNASIIRVTDTILKQKISEICHQAYVAMAPELWIFLVDNYRFSQIATIAGDEMGHFGGMDLFFQGASDALLGAANVNAAIESLGLGAVYLGSILNNPEEIVTLLNLPRYTFPILGLAFGEPHDNPQLKPKMPIQFKVGENTYPSWPNFSKDLEDYDKQMREYYDTRFTNPRSESFSDQILNKLAVPKPKREAIMASISRQGFRVEDSLNSNV